MASVYQGRRRDEGSPNACSGGQCVVALALTDKTPGFVREICPCRRSPVGPVVALVSICSQRTYPAGLTGELPNCTPQSLPVCGCTKDGLRPEPVNALFALMARPRAASSARE